MDAPARASHPTDSDGDGAPRTRRRSHLPRSIRWTGAEPVRRVRAPDALASYASFVTLSRALHDLLCTFRLRTDPGDWVLPGQVLACGYPRTESALAALAAAQVRVVVNLHLRPHAPAALMRHGLAEVHIPTRDFRAPPLPSLRHAIVVVEASLGAGQRVAVHCGGGRGRTGTLIACLLVARGEAPDAAIALARRLRPGAVETRAQQAAVHAFASVGEDGVDSLPILQSSRRQRSDK
jgi:protein-tyrosine phosphatase